MCTVGLVSSSRWGAIRLFWQAMILSILGYIPGFFMAIGLYAVAETQIQMPFAMTLMRAFGVFCATVLMCCLSAVIAIRKAWSADLAEVF